MLTRKDIINVLSEYDFVRNNHMQNSGEVDFDKKVIYLSTSQSYSEMKDTLIHEILHASYDQRDIKKSEKQIINETSKLVKRLK